MRAASVGGAMAPVLRGKKVTLRPPRDDDLDFAMRFANDEELRGWLRFWRPTTQDEERAWLRGAQQSDEPTWIIEHEARPVGTLALTQWDRVSRTAELGVGVLDGRSTGLGGEAISLALDHAFGEMGLQRVHLHVYADNPAVRLYERLGFRIEGTLRRHAWKRGAYRDQHVMGLLREEWRQ